MRLQKAWTGLKIHCIINTSWLLEKMASLYRVASSSSAGRRGKVKHLTILWQSSISPAPRPSAAPGGPKMRRHPCAPHRPSRRPPNRPPADPGSDYQIFPLVQLVALVLEGWRTAGQCGPGILDMKGLCLSWAGIAHTGPWNKSPYRSQ